MGGVDAQKKSIYIFWPTCLSIGGGQPWVESVAQYLCLLVFMIPLAFALAHVFRVGNDKDVCQTTWFVDPGVCCHRYVNQQSTLDTVRTVVLEYFCTRLPNECTSLHVL